MLEARLRDYFARDLRRIESGLTLVETEHVFPGGRIDILARNRSLVGIELKARPYDTQHVCVQLLNYLNYLQDGQVYFVAPKVKRGVYSTLRQYADRLRLYELRPARDGLVCILMRPSMLDDARDCSVYCDVERALPQRNLAGQLRAAVLRYRNGKYRKELALLTAIWRYMKT